MDLRSPSRTRASVASPAWIRPRLAPALFLLALYATTTLPWLIVVPPFDSPDEIAHYDYGRYIARTGHLPDRVPTSLEMDGWFTSHWPQPALYYQALSRLILAAGAADSPVKPLIAGDPATRTVRGPSARFIVFFEPPGSNVARAMYHGRLLSWSFGAIAALGLFAALGAIDASPRTRVLVVSLVLLVPGVAAHITAVNNDALAAMTAALGAAWILRASAGGRCDARVWLVAGLLVGVAQLSKATTSLLIPMALTAIIGATPVWRDRVRLALVFAAGVVLCLAGVWIRQWIVFGDPFASALAASPARFHPVPPTWTLMHRDLYAGVTEKLFEGFFAQFGWSESMPRSVVVWRLYRVVSWIALALMAVAAFVVAGRARGASTAVRVARVCGVGLVAHLAALFYINSIFLAPSGRHLLPALAPLLVLACIGARVVDAALERRGLTWIATLAPVALLFAMAAAWVTVLAELVMGFRFGG